LKTITLQATTPKKFFILGGTLLITKTPGELVTILGSCVSVFLWDKKLKIGRIYQ
jgi:chemotaxis receptor (MCP) glutamine deamidase CheD